MIMVNGKAQAGWRLDEVTGDMAGGMEMLLNPFAIVPKLENAQRIALAFQLLEEWLRGGVDAEAFRAKSEAVVRGDSGSASTNS